MHALDTCKNEEDPIKNEGARVFTRFLPWIFPDAQVQLTPQSLVRSGRISNLSEMLLMSSLPASMKKIRLTSSPKGNDAHLRAIIQIEKKWKHQFFRRLRAANSVISCWIWPNFKLIQANMYVIITCKYEKDPIKNNREKKATMFFQIITLSVAMETSGWIWPNFELIQASMHVLIACKYEKDQMKNSGENVMTSFSSL